MNHSIVPRHLPTSEARFSRGAETGRSRHRSDPPALGVAEGSDPLRSEEKPGRFVWHVEHGATRNYRLLGQRLAATGGLYRNRTTGHGLLQILPDRSHRLISKGPQLAPLLVDRIQMTVVKEGKVVSELPAANHLNTMLQSEAFLGNFLPVDHVTRLPVYLDDFSTVAPGYNDLGPGNRIFYLGREPPVVRSTATINAFLDAMDFASTADRTNTVAAALTVLLRWLWRGEKPLVLVTATKSHSGKGTITDFFRGAVPKADLLYESVDWPMQQQFQRQVQKDADIGVVGFDNVRLDSSGGRAKFLRSAFVEGFVTAAEITLASPGAGEVIRLANKYVVTVNSNDGALSPDLMNRSLPIHLAPVGDIQDRVSKIGNPKLEFLPANRDRIEAELRGMIENWKEVAPAGKTPTFSAGRRSAPGDGGRLRAGSDLARHSDFCAAEAVWRVFLPGMGDVDVGWQRWKEGRGPVGRVPRCKARLRWSPELEYPSGDDSATVAGPGHRTLG